MRRRSPQACVLPGQDGHLHTHPEQPHWVCFTTNFPGPQAYVQWLTRWAPLPHPHTTRHLGYLEGSCVHPDPSQGASGLVEGQGPLLGPGPGEARGIPRAREATEAGPAFGILKAAQGLGPPGAHAGAPDPGTGHLQPGTCRTPPPIGDQTYMCACVCKLAPELCAIPLRPRNWGQSPNHSGLPSPWESSQTGQGV